MSYFTQEFIEEVLDRNDIVDVISSYITLKKKGNNYWGLCPFHGEKTPSFSVNAKQQFYHCFGCHAGGDVISFVKKMERLDFTESVVFLAERARMSIPQQNKQVSSISSDEKSKMYELMTEAARFFYGNLTSDEGKIAREYISKRGISESILKRFGLGYSLNKWDELNKHLISKGADEKTLHKIGLLKEKDDRYYDTFRNRIMFPIIDSRARVIAFGGRVMDDSQPKYLNSPETPIFNKSYNLYGIHYLNKIKNVDKIIIVEGYMDVIALHKVGYTQVLASLGTALTKGQAKLMKRYSKDIYICYDGDGAGKKATLRGLDILQEEGLNVRVMIMPDGMDPDDYANKYGIVGIQDKMSEAKSLNDYKIDIIKVKYDLTIEEQRKDYLQECCKSVLSHIETPIELSMYINRLHMQTGFSKVAIEAETGMAKKALGKMNRAINNRDNIVKARNITKGEEKSQNNKHDQGRIRAERIALQLAIVSRTCREILFQNVQIDDFSDLKRKKIAKIIKDLDNQKTTIGKVLSAFDDSSASEIGGEDIDLIQDKSQAIKECISKIKKGIDKDIRKKLIIKIEDVTTPSDDRKRYMKQMQEIDKKRANGYRHTESEGEK